MRLSHHAPSGKTCNASVNHELFVDEYLRQEGAFARLTVWWRCIALVLTGFSICSSLCKLDQKV